MAGEAGRARAGEGKEERADSGAAEQRAEQGRRGCSRLAMPKNSLLKP